MRASEWLAVVLQAVCLVAIMYIGFQVANLSGRELIAVEELVMQTIETTWTSGGAEHSVKTPRLENESLEDWLRRHETAVSAAKDIWPPD